MQRLTTFEDFHALKGLLAVNRDDRVPTVVIPAGTCGQANGANDLIRVAKREILTRKLTDRVKLRITGCHGWCEMEPSVLVEPWGTFYPRVSPQDMARIIDAVEHDGVLGELLYVGEKGETIERQADIPFFSKQTRTLLSQSEKVDPIRIYNYVENAGYEAFVKVLQKGDPAWVINEVKESRLRGRGGAGFPTGRKWEMLAAQRRDRGKYVVCNADEGDPGAYMDRSLLEGNPHAIIEGMLIGAYATGATEGVIYVRNEYPLAIKHCVIALRQARELGLLGEGILGSGFSFNIRLVRGAGAFVCGEETALIASIEGRMGEPRQRPPYPIERGIEGKPTAINNVETWANVPVVIRKGAKEFARIGTATSTGTKIFSLVGKIKNTGLVEVPMGITLAEVVYDIGGGPSGRAPIKAVQTGGPSGGCIPASRFDLPIDYDNLAAVGSIMGSGGMIVMDADTCMVDVAKYFMRFLKDESCGKCFTCRKGTQRLYELLDDVTKGEATLAHLGLLEELAEAVKDTTMCGLGQSAPNPVLSTLRYFREEYERHIRDKRCDAFSCKELVGAACQAACPAGTEAWRYVALLEKGDYVGAYRVIRDANPFPSVCARVCHHPCEDKCRAGAAAEKPVAIRALKRIVTDGVDARTYEPVRAKRAGVGPVAIIGSGPAGLTAAHYLSLAGIPSTVFEAEEKAGGMLVSGIPAYRLNRDTLQKEVAAILDDDNISIKTKTVFGRDVTLDSLKADGFKAVFVATGAHLSRKLDILHEDADGVYPSMRFLKAWNLHGQSLAKGRVGVVGGGNSALDAARVAVRQKSVDAVTVFYRRTRAEMPAYGEEIEGALEEGITLVELVTPVAVNVEGGKLASVTFQRNELGERGPDGRHQPRPVPGEESTERLDTLVVAIGEQQGLENGEEMGLALRKDGVLVADAATLETGRTSVFAGGDCVTGPNTVIDAIAAGKKAAALITRYLMGEPLTLPVGPRLPGVYIPPAELGDGEATARRADVPIITAAERTTSFAEVELALTPEAATAEARRCLRCDLEFVQRETIGNAETLSVGERKHD